MNIKRYTDVCSSVKFMVSSHIVPKNSKIFLIHKQKQTWIQILAQNRRVILLKKS